MFLTTNCFYQLKYGPIIHKIAFSSEKIISSESGEICTDQAQFKSENSPKQI